MRYLIDGYNLMHALGVLGGRKGPGGLEKARLRLLGLLGYAHGDEAAKVTVVFDAAGAPAGSASEQEFRGIQVRFAHGREADDLIEDLIRQTPAPRRLTVVSDDRRIQQAARRRRCRVMGCGEYLEQLDRRHRRRPAPADPDAKPAGPSAAEAERWLREFADLADDPAARELSYLRELLEDEQE